LSNPGLPRKSSELSAASFDDIPEARRESVERPAPKLAAPPLWLGLAAIGLGVLGLGVFGLSRLGSNSAATAGINRTKPASGNVAQAKPDADGRLLNHYPYSETAQGNLDTITSDGAFKLHYKAAKAYKEMVAAAQADGVSIVPLSAFRSTKDQQELFFEVSRERNQRPQERANVSAPPGHSEHHTGYAIDVGDGNVPAVNLSPDFENTAAFQWLQTNAARYSFELSFPKNNEQGVTYEPWHWRFVGDSESLAMFYKARNVKPKAN
jgi:zinc D-Ala-D-Ala carboxypeptidase